MMRTPESFAAIRKQVIFFTGLHNKSVWIVPTEKEYVLSVIKPRPDELPAHTAANLYDINGEIIDVVHSSNK